MSYIRTRPPVSQAEIEDFVTRLEAVKTSGIDGFVLANLVRTSFECGLHNAELIELSIGDVSRKGIINDVISVAGEQIPLTDDAKGMLQAHIDYLKSSGYPMYPSKPLFPRKNKIQYYSRLLGSHLNNQAINGGTIGLEKIRQSGICKYYDQMRQAGFSVQECLEKTRMFARNKSYRATKDLLGAQIQPTGKKTNQFEEYLQQIEGVEFPTINKDKWTYQDIGRAIEKDSGLNENEKQALGMELESRIKKEKQKPRPSLNPSEAPRFTSITEAIKNTDPSDL